MEFAQGLRRICDRTGAVLVLDDVRSSFRLGLHGTWDALVGVQPDLSCMCKGIANGYPLAAVLGGERLRRAAAKCTVTGSFWCSAVPMVAALATIRSLQEEDGVGRMVAAGGRLRAGLERQAKAHGLDVSCSGPVQMPLMIFEEDRAAAPDGAGKTMDQWPRVAMWASECAKRGVWFHPYHNNFLSAAHSDQDIDEALRVSDEAFGVVAEHFGTRSKL